MRKLLLTGLLLGCVAGPQLAQAAPLSSGIAVPTAALSRDPAIQPVYWYWWHGRRLWRPGPVVRFGYGPGPYVWGGRHYWHRGWRGGRWAYW